jgi:hypothetical protein
MRVLVFMLGMLASLCVQASGERNDPVGYVKTASGAAWIVTADAAVPAQPGTPVYASSRLKTGTPGSLGVTLKDETQLSCGPDTELAIDEYLYAPSQGKLGLVTSLVRGSLEYLSGVIAKLKPDAVSVKTPTGTIGIRGTHFVVKVEEE